MAVFTAFTSRNDKKYKPAHKSEEAQRLSDSVDTSHIKIEYLSSDCVTSVCKQTPDNRLLRVLCFTVLVISLTLNVVVFLYLVTDRSGEDHSRPTAYRDRLVSAVHGDSVCTGCLSVGVDPKYPSSIDFRDLRVHQQHDGTYLCCLQNAKGLWRLLQLVADRHHMTQKLETADQSGSRTITGAHLFIDSEALKANPKILSWSKEYGFGSAFSSSDVIINDNQLHVTRPGLYHVYSFITFKTRQPRLRPDTVLQTIIRRNKHLPRLGSHVMLMDKTTLPEVSERFLTSFLSATVRLRKDDQLFVKVSNLSYVYEYAPSNFFGLYFVGD